MVDACTWSPDGMLIASASIDRTVRIWDGNTYEQHGLVPAHLHSELHTAHSLRFSPNANYLAWISSGPHTVGNCFIWRPLIGEQPKMLRPPPNSHSIQTAPFSFDPESRYIAIAFDDTKNNPDSCVVQLWDTATGAPVAVLTGHSQTVRSISFSPDGRSLLSMGQDMAMWMWDCGTWSGKQTGMSRCMDSLILNQWQCIQPDGKYVATGSDKGLVRLWRMSDGECVAVIDESSSATRWVKFSPNGQFLISGHENGMVYIHCLSRFITE